MAFVHYYPFNYIVTLFQNTDSHVSLCFTEAEVRALAKERQKKDNHNLSKYIGYNFRANSISWC